ncbi:golgin subfamily A member 6-like protein 7 [Syngnathoides biaculeatus]|uniref:golgin subfamily A member 6-like protein 7 n=1 Tax=Syngnathoides biaculeatus TaxID=300417 RepID=UPI002ADDE8B3|nr:golgin subfamily A member 6-like protein 7 [Syngnathoides biaculeatus]
MEDDSDSTDGFEPLFIQEEIEDPETSWSSPAFTRTHLSQPSVMGPYLQEMDDLLKSCEELTVIPLERKQQGIPGEKETSPYFSTSCTGNTMETTEKCVPHQPQDDMPVTLAGNKLRDTMVQYEGQLMDMLAMLESSMEEAGIDFEVSQDYVHVNKGKDQLSESQSVGQQECKTTTDVCDDDSSMGRSGSDLHVQQLKYSGVHGVNGAEFQTESLERDTNVMSFGVDGFEELKSQMEECIEELQRLERRRKDLLAEVLELRKQEAQEEEDAEAHVSSKVIELMAVLKKEEEDWRDERKREVQRLRSERAEGERQVWESEMARQELQDEMRKLKRQLFATARENVHTQAALNKRRHEMELQKREEEHLQTLLLQMTEENSQLRSAHWQHLQDLQEKLCTRSTSHTCNAMQDDVPQRNSCGDVQQYLQGSLKALEDRYEPILLALQKRKETTTGALVKAKDQTRELKAQLGPLREEMHTQVLQKSRLEEKLKLVQQQKREDTGHYEESIRCLERSSRELKMELTMQKRKNKEAEEVTDCLSKQILLYRSAPGDHQRSEHREEK